MCTIDDSNRVNRDCESEFREVNTISEVFLTFFCAVIRNSGASAPAPGLRNPRAQRSRDTTPDGRRSHVSGGEDLAFGDPGLVGAGSFWRSWGDQWIQWERVRFQEP